MYIRSRPRFISLWLKLDEFCLQIWIRTFVRGAYVCVFVLEVRAKTLELHENERLFHEVDVNKYSTEFAKRINDTNMTTTTERK